MVLLPETLLPRAQVRSFVDNPAFDPAVVSRSSQSAAVLAKWVIAMDDYQRVKKVRMARLGYEGLV